MAKPKMQRAHFQLIADGRPILKPRYRTDETTVKPGSTLSIDFKGWHIWESNGQVLISPEDVPDVARDLQYFSKADDAVNWLYLTGYKDVARRLNAELKARA